MSGNTPILTSIALICGLAGFVYLVLRLRGSGQKLDLVRKDNAAPAEDTDKSLVERLRREGAI